MQTLALAMASIGLAIGAASVRAQTSNGTPFLPDETHDLGDEWLDEEAESDEPLDTRIPTLSDTISVTLGFGGTWRLLVHADICDPDVVESCRFSPPYLQLQGTWSLPTYDELQHGFGLGIATTLNGEGNFREGANALSSWAIAPRYQLRGWFGPWFQIAGVFGVPVSLTGWEINGDTTLEANWGIELQANAIFKIVTGFGIYLGANFATYFALADSVWPTLSLEGGVVFDYEVLP